MAQGRERRQTIRLRAGEGSVVVESDVRRSPESPGFPLVDISEGGLCFLVPSSVEWEGGRPEVGEALDVTVDLKSLERPLKIASVVRRSSLAEGFGSTLVGLEFVDLDEWQKATLRGAVIGVARERIEEGYHVLREGAGREPADEDYGRLLGDVLVDRDVIGREELEELIAGAGDRMVGRELVRAGAISEWQLVQALAEQAGLEAVDLREGAAGAATAQLFTPAFFMSNRMIPLAGEGAVRVAVAYQPGPDVQAEVKKKLGDDIEFVIASEAQISQALHGLFGTGGRTRSSPRVAAEIPVVFSITLDACAGEVYEGLTQNISESGMLFAAAAPTGASLQQMLDTERSIRLRARLGGPDEVVEALCSPVRIGAMVAPPGHWLYAVRVDEISPEHLERLRVFQFYQRFGSDKAGVPETAADAPGEAAQEADETE